MAKSIDIDKYSLLASGALRYQPKTKRDQNKKLLQKNLQIILSNAGQKDKTAAPNKSNLRQSLVLKLKETDINKHYFMGKNQANTGRSDELMKHEIMT